MPEGRCHKISETHYDNGLDIYRAILYAASAVNYNMNQTAPLFRASQQSQKVAFN